LDIESLTLGQVIGYRPSYGTIIGWFIN